MSTVAVAMKENKIEMVEDVEMGSMSKSSIEQVHLKWENVRYSVQVETAASRPPFRREYATKEILKGMHGEARPGEFLAILGASGAGKTTLLNFLAQRLLDPNGAKSSGTVSVNGEPLDPTVLSQHSAYVMQEDIVLPTFTVRESLAFSARLRLPRSMSDADKMARVEEVIEQLGLQKCADTMIGNNLIKGISGGEKKRVSIGVELIHNPSILFVDEPTSGLDSFTAFAVVETLRELAQSGRTVICTLHQPSSEIYALFDKLLLMVDGQTVYLNPAEGAIEHFANAGFACPPYSNPADFFMRTMNVDCKQPATLKRLVDAYEKADIAKGAVLHLAPLRPLSEQRANVWEQLSLLSARSWKNYIRQPMLTKMRTAQTVFLALFFGLLYWDIGNDQTSVQDRNGALFFVCTNQLMISTISVVLSFPLERALWARETSNHMYSTFAYFISKSVSELPFQVLFPVVYCLIPYWMVGFQNTAGKFFIFTLVNIVVVSVGQSMGLLLGCAVKDATVAVNITPMALLPFMLFNGFFLNEDNIPPYFLPLKVLSPFKYAFEILAVNEYTGLDLGCTDKELVAQGVCPHTSGESVLRLLSLDKDNLIIIDFMILLTLLVGFRLVAYLLLLKQQPQKK